MERVELPAALALPLRADLIGTCERRGERLLEIGAPLDLAAHVAREAAQPRAQEAHLAMVALELLRMGITSRHHRRVLGEAQIGLSEPDPVLPRQAVQALDRGVQQLRVRREGVAEELLAGEVLAVRVLDPAIADRFVGQPVNVLEQQQPDREARRDARPALIAIKRRDLAVEPCPVDLLGEPHQLVLHVDDLIEP